MSGNTCRKLGGPAAGLGLGTIEPSPALGAIVRKARQRTGRTPEQLAAGAGVVVDCILQIEAGTWTPSDRVLGEILEEIGLGLDDVRGLQR